jgi:sugar lactone lactonase YvrE
MVSFIAVDSKGNIYLPVTYYQDKHIIRITPEHKGEIFAGGGQKFLEECNLREARFDNPKGIAIDSSDNIFVVDGNYIKQITPEGRIKIIAGNPIKPIYDKATGKSYVYTYDGDRKTATFYEPKYITVDNKGNIYITDGIPIETGGTGVKYYVIRKIAPDGNVSTIKTAGKDFQLKFPRGIACDKEGNLIVCAVATHCIQKITPDGIITTVAGKCQEKWNPEYKEGNISVATLTDPACITVASNGDIYFSDSRMNRIIKITKTKVITMAGSGKMDVRLNIAGYSDPGYVDGKGAKAMFDDPWGIAFDRKGDLFIVDRSGTVNSYIRKLSPDGIVSTYYKQVWDDKLKNYVEPKQ